MYRCYSFDHFLWHLVRAIVAVFVGLSHCEFRKFSGHSIMRQVFIQGFGLTLAPVLWQESRWVVVAICMLHWWLLVIGTRRISYSRIGIGLFALIISHNAISLRAYPKNT